MLSKVFFLTFLYLLSSAWGFANNGFLPIRDGYTPAAGTELKVSVPKGYSQGTFNMCFAFAAGVLLDTATCQKEGFRDCRSLSEEKRASPLDISRFAKMDVDPMRVGDRNQYPELDFGGALPWTLETALRASIVSSARCASPERIFSTADRAANDIDAKLWREVEGAFNAYRDELGRKDNSIASVLTLQKLLGRFDIQITREEIVKALTVKSYGEFLSAILVPDRCMDWEGPTASIELTSLVKMAHFPDTKLVGGEDEKYGSMIRTIKDVLSTGTPLGLTFCAEDTLHFQDRKSCNDSGFLHVVVIKGYKAVCKANDVNDCYDLVQIENSWGPKFEEFANDGWVSAEELMHRTFYDVLSLVWLEKR